MWGSGRLRLPDLLDIRHYEGGKVVTLTHRPPSPPGISWYSFLEAESTPGHMELSKLPEKILSVTTVDRSRDPSTCSAATRSREQLKTKAKGADNIRFVNQCHKFRTHKPKVATPAYLEMHVPTYIPKWGVIYYVFQVSTRKRKEKLNESLFIYLHNFRWRVKFHITAFVSDLISISKQVWCRILSTKCSEDTHFTYITRKDVYNVQDIRCTRLYFEPGFWTAGLILDRVLVLCCCCWWCWSWWCRTNVLTNLYDIKVLRNCNIMQFSQSTYSSALQASSDITS